jgi:hypothetical protein
MSAFARRSLPWGLSACLLLTLPAAGPAQDTPAQRRKAVLEGTHVFRRILYDHHLEPLKDFASLDDDPASTILIVLGNLDQITRVPGGLKSFVERGGAVLLASDRSLKEKKAADALRAVAGVSISDDTVVCLNGNVIYRGRLYCPFIFQPGNARPSLLTPPSAPAQYRVATNVPSFLFRRRRAPGTVRILAYLPQHCRFDTDLNQAPAEDWPPFMAGGEVGRGRVLVMADHSIFINEMMLETDNNNVEFTINCVRWLRGDEGLATGPRKHVLLVEDGKVHADLFVPLKSAVIGPEEALRLLYANRNELLVKAEETAVNLERQDYFNEQLQRLLHWGNLTPDRVALLVVFFATLLLILYGVYRLGIRARFKHPTEAPLLTRAVATTLPGVPLVDQRAQAVIRMGNLNEPAARLVGRWFESHGLPIDPSAPAEPPIEVTGGWWRRRQRRRHLGRLWRLAQGRSTERVEPAGLWRLQRELDRLDAGRARGEWRPKVGTDEKGRGTAA